MSSSIRATIAHTPVRSMLPRINRTFRSLPEAVYRNEEKLMTKVSATLMALLFFALLTTLFAQQQSRYFLDLTKFTPPPDSEMEPIESNSVFSMHEKIPVVPLKITIEPFKLASVRLSGDELTYDVILENISIEPFTIPWSADQRSSKLNGKYGDGFL